MENPAHSAFLSILSITILGINPIRKRSRNHTFKPIVTMSSLRRSTRTKRTVKNDIPLVSAYPDMAPATDFERKIAFLNGQSFPSSLFSEVDDILVYALFASKKRQRSYRACIPDTAFNASKLSISNEQGITIRHIYGRHTQGPNGIAGVSIACQALVTELPSIFKEDGIPIVQQ